MSNEIYEQITNLLSDKEIVNRHSFFQLRYFLVGKEPTNQARMWRCIRELEVRQQTIEAINLEMEDINDKKELLQIQITRLERSLADEPIFGVTDDPGEWALVQKELEIKLRRLRRKERRLRNLSTITGKD